MKQHKHKMGERMALLILIFLSASIHQTVLSLDDHQLHVVRIDGVNGRDSPECLNSIIPCQSLSFVADNLTRNNSVGIEIAGNLLNLSMPVKFNDYTYLTINGSGSKTVLYCNESEAGIAFVNVYYLTIHSLTIENCGAKRNSTSFNPLMPNETEILNVAVYILNCTDVTINHVNIQSSNGTGLSLYDTNGIVNIRYCNFINNSVWNKSSQSGGGGLHIEFPLCSPGITKCTGQNKRNANSNYIIQNCTLSHNSASVPNDRHTFISPLSMPRLRKGGGLYISIGSHAANNVIKVMNCMFKNNMAGFIAGGMLASFVNFAQNNSISVYETSFINNYCPQKAKCIGGGLVIGMMYDSYETGKLPSNNSFSCTDCVFTNNSAYLGGGTGIFATKDMNSPSGLSIITFIKCNWTGNQSPIGGAIYIAPEIWDYPNEGFLPVPLFIDCRIVSNTAIQELPSLGTGLNVTSVGYGAFYINEFKVCVMGSLYLGQNNGSAMHLSNSVLDVRAGSNITFYENTAHYGGAIAMFGSSAVRFEHNTTLYFIKNRAYSRGGAIFVDFMGPLQTLYHNCFFDSAFKNHTKIESSLFIFRENKADIIGSSIFATTFKSCETMCSKQKPTNPEDILQCIANFSFGDSTKHNVPLVTRPKHFMLNASNSTVKIMPGSEYKLPLTAWDENCTLLTGMVYEAAITDTNIMIDSAFVQVSNNSIRLLGENNDKGILHLRISDVSLSFNVTLVDCEPGYYLSGSECECASRDYLGVEGCEPHVHLKQGYWMGYCSNDSTKLCTTFCPYGYCSYNKMESISDKHVLPNDSNLLDQKICGPYRTGRVCSDCTDGHSTYFHSWKITCGSEELCDWGWFFYLLSEIVPLTILFIIIIVFNISFTSGNINCFVLFAQVLDALSINGNGALKFKPFIVVIQEILSQFYRPFNLDFFTAEPLSFCLWKGSNSLDTLLMEYVTVGFALSLVLLTILMFRFRCTSIRFRMFQTSNSVLIHGLSAFFILGYSQSARVSFDILTSFCLYSHNFYCEKRIVYLMGYMTYLEGEHIKYAIIAILVLIFVVIIPPLLLLIYPLVFKLLGFCKLSESKLATILWRVMPIQLLDAFQSSFKDEYRFFAAFYFIYRAMVLVAFAYSPTVFKFYSVVQLMLIAALALHAVFQPHKKREHNIIDALLFTNLAIINAITLYNYARKDYIVESNAQGVTIMASIQAFLISLPFLCIIFLGVAKWKQRRNRRKNSDHLPSLRSVEYKPLIQQ